MLLFRFVFGGLLLTALFCFGMALVTRDPRWRARGVVILKWTMLAAAGFFAVLLASHYFSGRTP